MVRRIGWSDVSYCQNMEGKLECWVPEATIFVYEEGFETAKEFLISDEKIDILVNGKTLYPTRAEASAKMRELIVPYVIKKYGIAEADIREYCFSLGHAFQA